MKPLAKTMVVTVAGGGQMACTREVEFICSCKRMLELETEFLLSDDTLNPLGIDVHRQREQLVSGDLMAGEDPFELQEDR
ncbi:Hypothetical protein PHPALM_17949 [Phytophthora palmivora]|uniref:Uncharacterized protein n=1 Tax=Phytophthora palmivora TaxID=4796 RepID=A0A2P4XKY7_9STRA|nr:Hypothetical protein PHPALM_17949 [Phytophthora palmivora]